MTMNDLEKILSTSFLVPMGDPRDEKCVWGLNVMLWGPPGIGKSERIENAGAMVGLPVRPTYIPTCQPEDASGAPFANATKGLAMMESILFTLEEYLEDSEGNLDTEATWAEAGLNRLMGVHREKSFNFVPKVIKNMVRAARRYGPGSHASSQLCPAYQTSSQTVKVSGSWMRSAAPDRRSRAASLGLFWHAESAESSCLRESA
jgi:hypothetical protein